MKPVNILMGFLLIIFIANCGSGTSGVTDNTTPRSARAYIEYDSLPGWDIGRLGYTGMNSLLDVLYGKKNHKTGIVFGILYNGAPLEQPGSPLFSISEQNGGRMISYALAHRAPNNYSYTPGVPVQWADITYPYHLLAVDRAFENQSSGTVTTGLSVYQTNSSSERFNRCSFVFVDDLINKVLVGQPEIVISNHITKTVAHELGHQIAGLTDVTKADQYHSQEKSNCIMNYYNDLSIYARSDFFTDSTIMVFCNDASNNNCAYRLRNQFIDTIKTAQ